MDDTRFFTLSASSLIKLVEIMNENQEGTARVIFMGQTNHMFVAVFDRAVQPVFTPEMMFVDNTIDVELEDIHTSLSA